MATRKMTIRELTDEVKECRTALKAAMYCAPADVDVEDVRAKFKALMAALAALHRHGRPMRR